ncbi:hypothetical protein CRUP_037992 [Coryphaenoides rupestris]|nr:hypothetical protein CRUP_037992 [Coryphaenoides rupestris]
MCNSKQLVALTGPQCDRHHNSLSGQKRSVLRALMFSPAGGASITAAATFSSSCCCSSSFRAWAAARCSSSSCSRRRRALAFFSCSALQLHLRGFCPLSSPARGGHRPSPEELHRVDCEIERFDLSEAAERLEALLPAQAWAGRPHGLIEERGRAARGTRGGLLR